MLPRLARVAVILLALLWPGAVSAAVVVYEEELSLTWGLVQFTDEGLEAEEEVWFSRTPPTFAQGGIFTEQQRVCLSNSFQVCVGRVGQTTVWRIDSSVTGAFPERALADGCTAPGTFAVSPVPDDLEPGETGETRWTLRIRCELPSEEQPPATLELVLVTETESVPVGTAWEVPIPTALADPQVRAFAGLSAEQESAAAATATWASLYLVAPGTLRVGQFPEVVPAPDLAEFAVPLAFGVRALAEIGSMFGEDRSLTVRNRDQLVARLSPDQSTAFEGAHRWFPEADASRGALEVSHVASDVTADRLVRVSMAPPPGFPFEAERVVETNQWAIRVGPFRRLAPAVTRVGFMKGKEDRLVPVADLPTLITNPVHLAALQQDVKDIEENLSRKLVRRGQETNTFFWLPAVTRPQARAVRALEGVRFTEQVQSVFETNHFTYLATYSPALITGRIGISYNPEQGFGGHAEAGWNGFLTPRDSFVLRGSVAERLLEGEASYQLRYYRSLDRRTELYLEAFGNAGTHDHFRVGSLSPDPFRHEQRSAGVEHTVRHTAGTWELTVRDAFLWEHHDLDQPDSAAPVSERAAGFLWRHQQTWLWQPDAAPTDRILWRFAILPSMTLGPEAGWDDSFWLGELGFAVRADFGGAERRNMFVRMRGSVGGGVGSVPAALLFRLGDGNRLLGLESGEVTGRSFVYGELAYGFDVEGLFQRMFKGITGREENPIFNGLKIVALAEIGAAAAAEGLKAVSDPDEVVSSFGVALEKENVGPQGAALRLGYGWSPDSVRTGGRFFTSLSWGF